MRERERERERELRIICRVIAALHRIINYDELQNSGWQDSKTMRAGD